MTDARYNDMIDMLKQATKNRKLQWEQLGDYDYRAMVSDCEVRLVTYMNYDVHDSTATLSLANENGDVFDTRSYSSNVDIWEYDKLLDLMDAIRDSYYHITESENKIMNTLKILSSDTPSM